MFNPASVNDFKEKADYESMVIKQAVDIFQLQFSIGNADTIVMEDDITKPVTINLDIQTNAGTALSSKLINEMIPLLFCAGYKILDMI